MYSEYHLGKWIKRKTKKRIPKNHLLSWVLLEWDIWWPFIIVIITVQRDRFTSELLSIPWVLLVRPCSSTYYDITMIHSMIRFFLNPHGTRNLIDFIALSTNQYRYESMTVLFSWDNRNLIFWNVLLLLKLKLIAHANAKPLLQARIKSDVDNFLLSTTQLIIYTPLARYSMWSDTSSLLLQDLEFFVLFHCILVSASIDSSSRFSPVHWTWHPSASSSTLDVLGTTRTARGG